MKKFLFVFALLLVSGGVALAQNGHFTASVSQVSDTKATLTGHVQGCCDSYNGTTIGPFYYFEYGTTTGVIKATENVTLEWNNGDNENTVNEPSAKAEAIIRDLKPDTKYYYRFVQKIGNTNESGFTYRRSDLKSFKTLDDAEEPSEEKDNELTDEQIEGLEDLGFTERQIKMVIALFAKKDHDGPNGLACGYRHKLTLRHGMWGEDIKEMQKALRLNADGKFGKLTMEAVKRFQAEHGLPSDGVIGPKTGLKLGLLCHKD